jgi:hypothetical protein
VGTKLLRASWASARLERSLANSNALLSSFRPFQTSNKVRSLGISRSRVLVALSSTTMKFLGGVCGKAFSGIDASYPQDLYRIVAEPKAVPMEEVRCWS